MLSIKLIGDGFYDIWWYPTTSYFELLTNVLLSIGVVAISIPTLAIDLLISPIEIIALVVWIILKKKGGKTK